MKLWKKIACIGENRQSASYFGFFMALLIGGLFLFSPFIAQAATYVVDNTGDASGQACLTGTPNDCSLRSAIEQVNLGAGGDDINFADIFINGTQQTITVSSILPAITKQVVVSAENEWDTINDRPGIKLTESGGVTNGIRINNGSNGTRISGLKIEGFDNFGIVNSADDGTQIGLDCLGAPNTHQRNVIVGNGDSWGEGGMYNGNGNNVHIAGNWWALDDDGSTWNSNTSTSIRINTSNHVVVGYDDGDDTPALAPYTFACTQAQARNVFAPDSNFNVLVWGYSTGGRNKISGNYFNILPDGSNIIAEKPTGENMGVYFFEDAAYNIVGTDGDGVNDDKEGNVGAGLRQGMVFGYTFGAPNAYNHNRVSGNIFGGDPTGTYDIYTGSEVEQGVRFLSYGQENIIGYCDDSDEAGWAVTDICSNAGSAADQRNYFIGLNNGPSPLDITTDGSTGIQISFLEVGDNKVYGNYFGIGKDSSSIPNISGLLIGLGEDGLQNYIGDSGVRANTIKNNSYGMFLSTRHERNDWHSSGWVVQHNDISNNSVYGILLFDTNQNQGAGSEIPLIQNNTINNNGETGIYMTGSSAEIKNNTINSNGDYGIYSESKLNDVIEWAEYPDRWNPYYPKQTHLDSAHDLVSQPEIGGAGVENDISGNSAGGIYFVDAMASNEGTLESGNNIGDNNGNFDIRSTWWGGVEILYKDLNPIKSGSNTVYIVPQSGATYFGSNLDNGEFTNPPYPGQDTDEGAWGPAGFDYDNEPTWFHITDYKYDKDGNKTEYGPFTIKVSGDYANDALNPTFTFNGKDDDTCPGGLPCYYDTDGLWRYQIADAIVSTVPNQPANTAPASGAVNQKTDVTLSASAFSDAAETHSASQWQVYTSSSQCAADSGAILNTGDGPANTSYAVPYGSLAKGVAYWWHVRYKNSYGNYSDYSDCTVFTTSSSNIVQTGTVPNQTWDEDTKLTNAFDLDDYFTDLRGLAMHYEVLGSDNPANITVTINSDNKVSFTPKANWYGTATVTFKAIDTEGDTKNSNQVTLTVNNVNDPPGKVTKGFSPANGATTSSQLPTLKWTAPSDPDHSKAELYYRVRIGKNSDPANSYEYVYTSATGSPEASVINALDDETDYYWTVRAIDPDGLKGEWSDAKKFYVNTSLDPEISVTKTVTVGTAPVTWLNKIISMAMAATGSENVEFRELDYAAYQIPLWSLLFMFLTLFIVTLLLSGGLKKPQQVIFRSPARSFPVIATANKKGTWQMSYDQFRSNAKTNHWAAIGAGAVTAALVVFAIFSPAIKAADDNGVPVEPGNYLKYTLTYRNTGDGDATSINIRDYVPAGTYLTSYNGTASINNTTIDFYDTSIAPGQSKSVSFTVRVANPCFVRNITGSTASFTSNEITGGDLSNETSNPVETSTLTYHVQDAFGDPIPGSFVYIYKDGYKISSGATNEFGELTFYGLGSGVYYAEVFGPSALPATATAYTSLGRNSSAAQTITLALEEIEDDEYIIIIVDEKEWKIPRHIPIPMTEKEKQELKETMENFLKLLMVNETNVEDMDFFEAVYGDVPGIEEYIDEEGNVQTLINVSGPELVLKGLTLPYATVTVKIRSEEVVRVTKADEYGRWEIRVPMELLPEGEHTVYAQSELYGVETDEIVLGKFVIPEEGNGLSKTMWLFLINLGLIVIFAIFMFFYTKKRGLTLKKK